MRNNTGGLHIIAGSIGAATKLQANVTNNLFESTRHWPALYMATRENSAYQHALIAYNDFSWSYSPYHDVITLAQVRGWGTRERFFFNSYLDEGNAIVEVILMVRLAKIQ